MIQAIEVHSTNGPAKVFRPTGVTDEWELCLHTARGLEPGGHWTSADVARAVVDDIYNGGQG